MKAPEPQDPQCDISIFKVGTLVNHSKFGRGTIKDIQREQGRITVDFLVYGPKVLSVDKARLEILSE